MHDNICDGKAVAPVVQDVIKVELVELNGGMSDIIFNLTTNNASAI